MDKLKVAILQDRLNRVEQSRYNDPDLQSPIKDHVTKAAQFLFEKPNVYGVNLTAIARKAATTTTYALQCFVESSAIGLFRNYGEHEQEWLALEKAHPQTIRKNSCVPGSPALLVASLRMPDTPIPLPVEAAILLYDHHRERETIQERKTALRNKLAQLANDPLSDRSPEVLADKLIMLGRGGRCHACHFQWRGDR